MKPMKTSKELRTELFKLRNQDAKIEVKAINGTFETTVSRLRKSLFDDTNQNMKSGVLSYKFL